MRYFILKNESSLEVVGAPFEAQPDNSILWFENSFVKPIFDVYPNPTTVIEGATQEEIAEANKQEVPFEVPLWAMRTILKQVNLFDLVIDKIKTFEEPTRTIALDFLEYGNFVERYSNTVLLIQQIIQYTDEQVDKLFIDANNLKL
jgi:hypothetical protein